MRYLPLLTVLLSTSALADPRTDCPQTPCKVLTLTADEEKVLTGQNGIFDTAAVGRQLELSGFVTYFRNKVASAPTGDAKPAATPTDSVSK